MSALPPKADMVQRDRDVRFVPKADISFRRRDIRFTRISQDYRQSTPGCPLSAKSDFAVANLHLDLAKGAEL